MPTTTKEKKMPELIHLDGCQQARDIETTRYPERQLTTHHCIDCGSHLAVRDDGSIKPAPTQAGPFNHDEAVDHEADLLRPTQKNGGAR